ncbi:nuclear transport factor 2 family protein [Ramlibacter sp. G-1-2-2]|uniref:Nuclear transport factor 2 family protein n=1 Tax=Ramlibacter agri TaxID=2728837 RepID=A0A848HH31_9BURK|nr:nuclear transport factor 2 family protein [Ramlibacter agri]NML48739.1 nuclear transport factor 2 family protein [Ramlibacter agri]
MPVVSITLLPGYGSETEGRLVQRVALATRSVIAAPAAGTTVFVEHASTYMRDSRVFSGGGPSLPEASKVVRDFLGRMQDRDLAAARDCLAPGFEMVFPGGAHMTQLEQLVEWARGRYRSVAKDYERFDESWGDGVTVVYCSGTLRGTWPDGQVFQGIRFIDRFEVADGKLRRQDVWNDLAEARPA